MEHLSGVKKTDINEYCLKQYMTRKITECLIQEVGGVGRILPVFPRSNRSA